jgi:hypothetical protein
VQHPGTKVGIAAACWIGKRAFVDNAPNGKFARRFETRERRSNPATPTKFPCADKKSFSVCVIGYTLAGRVLTTSVAWATIGRASRGTSTCFDTLSPSNDVTDSRADEVLKHIRCVSGWEQMTEFVHGASDSRVWCLA